MKSVDEIKTKLSTLLIVALIMTSPGSSVLANGLNNGHGGGTRRRSIVRVASSSDAELDDDSKSTPSDIGDGGIVSTPSDIILPDDIATSSTICDREVISLNEDWTFTKDGETENVDVPHCWENYVPSQNTMDSQATATYEKTLDLSAYTEGHIDLRFKAINKKAVIYIDDQYVMTHNGGFTAFVVDLSEYKGRSDVKLRIDVTNIDVDTIPINTDFTHWAGIYRDVDLIVTSDVHIANNDYGSNGVYIDSKVNLADDSARVNINTVISNDLNEDAEFYVRATVSELNDTVVATTASEKQRINGKGQNSEISLDAVTIDQPHLWQGVSDPYLYNVEVGVYDEQDELLDSIQDKIGLRSFEVKTDGFYLNGQPYKLHCVGFHQDRDGYGNAVSKEMKQEDLDIIQEMGANALRVGHYPNDEYIYDLADEMGFVVWSEIPFYLIMCDTKLFRENTKEQMSEMIRQNYNHPSIICWGIQNEVNLLSAQMQRIYSMIFPNGGFSFGIDTLSDYMKELAAYAKKEDGSRLISQAVIDHSSKFDDETMKWTADSDIDVTAVNIYAGWYSNVSSASEDQKNVQRKQLHAKIQMYIDKMKKAMGKEAPFALTEFGAGANINQHAVVDGNFEWKGTASTTGTFHPEEYQSYVHEMVYPQLDAEENLWLASVWSMFDFSSYRNEGGQVRLNDKGLVTYDRSTKKDAYYFYKANWNQDDPFVYITSRRFTERKNSVTQVKVYSNCENVALTVNGTDYGIGTKTQDGVFVWNNVSLKESGNEVAAYSVDDTSICDTVDSWTIVSESSDSTDKPEESESSSDSETPSETTVPTESVAPTETVAPIETTVPEESVSPSETIVPTETTVPAESASSTEAETSSASNETNVPDSSDGTNSSNTAQNSNSSSHKTSGSGSGGSGSSRSNGGSNVQNAVAAESGNWISDANGWKWHKNGQYAAATWKFIKDGTVERWYHFDGEGYANVGWYVDSTGAWYYLNDGSNPNEPVGSMMSGWITDPLDKYHYYLDPVTGKMAAGWKKINGVWYYFNEKASEYSGWFLDPKSKRWSYSTSLYRPYGAMYVNDVTPDGYKVGEDGAMLAQAVG